jgi:hypothetical protein
MNLDFDKLKVSHSKATNPRSDETLLERLTQYLVSIGIGSMNAKSANEIEAQAKQLGDAFLPGDQSALRTYTSLITGPFDGA